MSAIGNYRRRLMRNWIMITLMRPRNRSNYNNKKCHTQSCRMSCLIVLEGEQLQHYAGISNQLENVRSTIVRWFFMLEERELMVGSRKHALSEFIIIIIIIIIPLSYLKLSSIL